MQTPERYDVVIAGGGLVGMTLGVALAGAGLGVAVIDAQPQPDQLDEAYDGRASAIAHGSARVFDGIGLGPHLAQYMSPIWDIRVVDGHPLRGISPLFLHYDHTEIGDGPFGYIIENRHIRQALAARAAEIDTLTLIAPARIAQCDRGALRATVTLSDGRSLQGAVVIGCEGRKSPLREAANIGLARWDYGQTSIVCTVAHDRPHAGVAVELFLPTGPFAMLPMIGDRSNVVWSESHARARLLMALPEEDFLAELTSRFGDWLGAITLTGPRFAYPLSLQHAQRYTDQRLALAGDAAHGIHPIAGQGFNLGVRDVAALAETLVDAHRLGLDLGSDAVLEGYERRRRFDNQLLIAVTDGLTRLFSNDIGPLRLARDLGMAAINRAGPLQPLKHFLMRHAMGMVGDLPRLIRGERL